MQHKWHAKPLCIANGTEMARKWHTFTRQNTIYLQRFYNNIEKIYN